MRARSGNYYHFYESQQLLNEIISCCGFIHLLIYGVTSLKDLTPIYEGESRVIIESLHMALWALLIGILTMLHKILIWFELRSASDDDRSLQMFTLQFTIRLNTQKMLLFGKSHLTLIEGEKTFSSQIAKMNSANTRRFPLNLSGLIELSDRGRWYFFFFSPTSLTINVI